MAMNMAMKALAISFALIAVFVPFSHAQTCKNYTFSNSVSFSSCNDLPVLNSFLYWNYTESTNQVQIAYRQTGVSTNSWAAWALNPSGKGMVGSQALVAYQNSTGAMVVYTSPITSLGTNLAAGSLSFDVSNLSAIRNGSEITIFATLQLSSSLITVQQVWNSGPVSSDVPQMHSTSNSANVNSKASVNFLSGVTTASGGGIPRQKRKNIHGVLNAVSWGTLLPMGAMIARYMKVFKSADPAWFYLHVSCQLSAYIIGVAGWATGLKLGSDSSGITFDTHRNIGIVLFTFGTLQLFALLLRPKKDHKYRLYWNIYHHSIGYLVIILSVINIYKGFDILDPAKKWKRIYTGILIFLGAVAAILEVFTWTIVIKRKKDGSDKFPSTANGAHGYGTRTQPA